MKQKQALVLSALITLLIAFNIYFFSNPYKQEVIISRVIDGDTFVTESGETIRLLNINTPESSRLGYEEAKIFLKQFENKTVLLEPLETDKYSRTLARVYTPEYLNLRIVEKGLATKFLVNKNELSKFSKAEEKAIKNEQGIWKKSPYFNCINSQINKEDEFIILKNSCNEINIDSWILRDESRKEYTFNNIILGEIRLNTFQGIDNKREVFWGLSQNAWNNDRDTLYLFDKDWNLVHYESYGY